METFSTFGLPASAACLLLSALTAQARAAPEALGARLLRSGKYEEAERAARKAGSATLVGEIARETGRSKEAIAAFRQALAKDSRNLRARIYLALTLQESGNDDEAKRLFDSFYDDWDAGLIHKDSAEELMYVAMAARATGGYQDANDTFREAVKTDSKLAQANLEWGELFLEKYAAGHAETCFAEVLRLDPRHPRAHVGMARVKLEQGYNVRDAEAEIDAALAENPRDPDAHALRALISLEAEDHESARLSAKAALKTNGHHRRARIVLAASAWLRAERGDYNRLRAEVLAEHPRDSSFDRGVAEILAKFNRYDEALAMEKAALALRADDASTLAGYGTNLLRLGKEPEGLGALRRAWEGDRFNVRTYNILNLFEETIPREYTFAKSKNFRLRLPKTREASLKKPVLDHLERAFAFYRKKYGYEPETPIVVELFEDPKHYAVRTVGLPGLGAMAVCFGRVITGVVPSGKFNWAQVLWHELSHVFTIGMSQARIPRWMTEGMADHETTIARTEWRRRSARELHEHLRETTMPPLAQLHRAFAHARDIDDIVLAYYYSEQAVDFLDRRFGMKALLEIVRKLETGTNIEQALTETTGLREDAIDREFRADLKKKLAHYDGHVSPSEAKPLLQAALEATDEPSRRTALAKLSETTASGRDGYAVRVLAAGLAEKLGDMATAATHLEAAARLDPEAVEPLARLVEILEKSDPERSFALLRRLGPMAGMDLGSQKKLLGEASRRGLSGDARCAAQIVLHLDPTDAEARKTLEGRR